ncbi:Ryncolin-1 [Portunus trituberculatus]|uniref:Ryncolin-1 n=1 Tax=Portunus trituberculatus TaxID=210409 RepID=A0A5B7DCT3_PORTR|nr:Ryncolin-1 [Portunus trituberculatus]
MEGGDGGWLVVQRRARVAEQVDFNLGWDEYKKGFGDLETEFWIGNDFLHVLTNQKTYQLRFDFHDYEDGPFYAAYRSVVEEWRMRCGRGGASRACRWVVRAEGRVLGVGDDQLGGVCGAQCCEDSS